MCMIYRPETDEVLALDKVPKHGWGGVTFPGGHVEPGESFLHSVIREVKEETGLTIHNVEYAGVIHYAQPQSQERWLCFLYRTSDYEGTLIDQTDEGRVFWIKRDLLPTQKLAPDMDKYLELFLNPHKQEAFAPWNQALTVL